MKLQPIIACCLVFIMGCQIAAAQVAINTNGSPANNSSVLDVQSTTKGMLLPRMSSAQRKAIVNPALGLLVFDTTEKTLYMYDGNRWTGFVAALDNTRPVNNIIFPPVTGDTIGFGFSVSLWENFAAIGAPLYSSSGSNYSGGVFIYHKTNGIWSHQTTLTPPAGVSAAEFGKSLDLCGNNLIVGAPSKKNASNQIVGAAYIYSFINNTWQLQHTVNGTEEETNFGYRVDINQFGNYALVSEPQATVNTKAAAGKVHIYSRSGATWSLQISLQIASPQAHDGFGIGAAMSSSGDYVVVGAPYRENGNVMDAGYAAVYMRSGATWTLLKTFPAPAIQSAQLGLSVDITDGNAAALSDNTNTIYHMPHLGNANPLSLTSARKIQFFSYMRSSTEPTTAPFYKSEGNIYDSENNLIKSLVYDSQMRAAGGALAIYDNDFCVGLPYESKKPNSFDGGIFFFSR